MLQELKYFVIGGFFTTGLFIAAGVADSNLSVLGMLKWACLGLGLMCVAGLLGWRWCRDES